MFFNLRPLASLETLLCLKLAYPNAHSQGSHHVASLAKLNYAKNLASVAWTEWAEPENCGGVLKRLLDIPKKKTQWLGLGGRGSPRTPTPSRINFCMCTRLYSYYYSQINVSCGSKLSISVSLYNVTVALIKAIQVGYKQVCFFFACQDPIACSVCLNLKFSVWSANLSYIFSVPPVLLMSLKTHLAQVINT